MVAFAFRRCLAIFVGPRTTPISHLHNETSNIAKHSPALTRCRSYPMCRDTPKAGAGIVRRRIPRVAICSHFVQTPGVFFYSMVVEERGARQARPASAASTTRVSNLKPPDNSEVMRSDTVAVRRYARSRRRIDARTLENTARAAGSGRTAMAEGLLHRISALGTLWKHAAYGAILLNWKGH